MTKTKQRRGSDDAQTATIVEPDAGCRLDGSDSTELEPVTDPNHSPTKPAPRSTRLCALLSSEPGASLTDICVAFGWQPHSARAALSGLRKSGSVIERIIVAVSDDGTGSLAKGLTRYRITLADRTAS